MALVDAFFELGYEPPVKLAKDVLCLVELIGLDILRPALPELIAKASLWKLVV